MKPFQLDTVLDHRKRLVDIAANRLFEAGRQKTLIQKKLQEEGENLEILIDKTEALQSKTIPILDLINYENQIHSMKNNILAIKKNLREKTKQMQKERQNLIQRSKDRQIMVSLKEQQNRSWKQYLDKKEVSMLDEIAVVRHERRQ
jgi:flagellar FliJ protein